MTADEVLNALKEAGIIYATEIIRPLPTNYTRPFMDCVICGQELKYCNCKDNAIIETIRELEEKEKKQWVRLKE